MAKIGTLWDQRASLCDQSGGISLPISVAQFTMVLVVFYVVLVSCFVCCLMYLKKKNLPPTNNQSESLG